MLRPWARSKKLRRACGGNPREACTRHIGRSGSKTRCGWAKRTSSPIAGPGKVHAPVPPTINGPNRLICLVRSVPTVEPAPPSCCRLATAKPCSSISTRSQPKSPSERTPLSSLIRPDGMAPKPWWFPTTSHSCRCRRAHLNSTARKTSGSSCARIGCQTGFSNPSTISSTTAATLGTHSSTTPGRLCPSRDATGQKSVTQSEDWYYTMSQQSSLTQSAHSVRQVLTAYRTHQRPFHTLRKRVPNPNLPLHIAHLFMAAFECTCLLSRCGLTAPYLATCAQEDFCFQQYRQEEHCQ